MKKLFRFTSIEALAKAGSISILAITFAATNINCMNHKCRFYNVMNSRHQISKIIGLYEHQAVSILTEPTNMDYLISLEKKILHVQDMEILEKKIQSLINLIKTYKLITKKEFTLSKKEISGLQDELYKQYKQVEDQIIQTQLNSACYSLNIPTFQKGYNHLEQGFRICHELIKKPTLEKNKWITISKKEISKKLPKIKTCITNIQKKLFNRLYTFSKKVKKTTLNKWEKLKANIEKKNKQKEDATREETREILTQIKNLEYLSKLMVKYKPKPNLAKKDFINRIEYMLNL